MKKTYTRKKITNKQTDRFKTNFDRTGRCEEISLGKNILATWKDF